MKPDNKDGHIKVQVTEQLHVSEPHSNSHPVLLCEKELNVLSFKSANLNLKIGLALEYFCFLLDQPSLCRIFCGHLSPVPGIQSSGKDHPNVFGTLDNSISYLKNQQMAWPGSKWYCNLFLLPPPHRNSVFLLQVDQTLSTTFCDSCMSCEAFCSYARVEILDSVPVSEPRISWTVALHFLLWFPKYSLFIYFFQHCNTVLSL